MIVPDRYPWELFKTQLSVWILAILCVPLSVIVQRTSLYVGLVHTVDGPWKRQ